MFSHLEFINWFYKITLFFIKFWNTITQGVHYDIPWRHHVVSCLVTKISKRVKHSSWLSNRWCITGLRNKVTITLGHYQHSSKKELKSIVHCDQAPSFGARSHSSLSLQLSWWDVWLDFFSFKEMSVLIIKGVNSILVSRIFFFIHERSLIIFQFFSF